MCYSIKCFHIHNYKSLRILHPTQCEQISGPVDGLRNTGERAQRATGINIYITSLKVFRCIFIGHGSRLFTVANMLLAAQIVSDKGWP